MTLRSDLHILFPTNFSDACFRTSHALAQLADLYDLHLTMMHVVPPGGATSLMRRELASFMPEADYYGRCRRLLVESTDPARAIAQVEANGEFDLLLAPGAKRVGLWRMMTPSFRAGLLLRCRTPVWTAGANLPPGKTKAALRTVACVINFDAVNDAYLPHAVALAYQGGAKVKIAAVLRPVDEGTLAHSLLTDGPLLPEAAIAQIRGMFPGQKCPEIDVAVGYEANELPRLLARAEADLAFVGRQQAVSGGLFGARMAPWLDQLPCPTICVGKEGSRWERWGTLRKANRDQAPWRPVTAQYEPELVGLMQR